MIQDNITPIVIVMGALLVTAVALVFYLFLRIRHIEGDYELLIRDAEGHNFAEIVSDNIAQVDGLTTEVDGLSDAYGQVLRRLAGAVQHVGVVRFDAFRDMGGMLSFAVALLDDRGNGLVFSSIYGRSDSRTYAKPIVERSSSYELSPEEREAIRLAMQSKELGALPMEARDPEHEERMTNLKLFHDREYLQRSPQGREVPEPRPRRAREPEPEPAGRIEEPEERREAPPRRRPRPGRAGHVGQPQGREPEKQKAPPAEDRGQDTEVPQAGDRLVSWEDFEDLADEQPGRPRGEERPPARRVEADDDLPREEPRRARGLNTPVERLRDRERRGE
ncbi:MAG: DUF4446 family protein [Actinobacteria bacterium]|nr:DUF4446 family protein [Actinomycetota bacterium]